MNTTKDYYVYWFKKTALDQEPHLTDQQATAKAEKRYEDMKSGKMPKPELMWRGKQQSNVKFRII